MVRGRRVWSGSIDRRPRWGPGEEAGVVRFYRQETPLGSGGGGGCGPVLSTGDPAGSGRGEGDPVLSTRKRRLGSVRGLT